MPANRHGRINAASMDAGKARRIARAYLLSIALWAIFSLLSGYQNRILDSDWNLHSTTLEMIVLAESRGLAFALLTPPIFFVVRRFSATPGRIFGQLLTYTVGVIPFTVLFASIRWILLRPWTAVVQRYVPRAAHGPFELIRTGFADQITMYVAIIAGAHAYVYFERLRRQELERYEFRQALAASELQALKMQLHPHFLFNTLHGISTLIDSDHDSAKAMVVKLSSLLRTALEYSGSDLVSLQEELKFVREYLDLEKMRFGARLTVIWNIQSETRGLQVPQLILQPVVENALRHGIASSREAGWIEISSRRTGNALELSVRNSVGIMHLKGTGVGLRNTEARLQHLFSGEATLFFVVSEDQTATTTIRFPALAITQPAA
jgi:two-component system, LytTR family, sensor kinase